MKTTLSALILALALTLPTGAEKPATPLSTISAAQSLLTLAEQMQGQGMMVEAEAVLSIIPTVLTGTPQTCPK